MKLLGVSTLAELEPKHVTQLQRLLSNRLDGALSSGWSMLGSCGQSWLRLSLP